MLATSLSTALRAVLDEHEWFRSDEWAHPEASSTVGACSCGRTMQSRDPSTGRPVGRNGYLNWQDHVEQLLAERIE